MKEENEGCFSTALSIIGAIYFCITYLIIFIDNGEIKSNTETIIEKIDSISVQIDSIKAQNNSLGVQIDSIKAQNDSLKNEIVLLNEYLYD